MTGFAVVFTTTTDADEARDLARALVEARLAACVQITPVISVYRWEGAVTDGVEQLLACKIAAVDFDAVAAAIRAKHRYEVPEIVMTPISAGDQTYLEWLAGAVAR